MVHKHPAGIHLGGSLGQTHLDGLWKGQTTAAAEGQSGLTPASGPHSR
jgi:hypothetical protein